MGHIAGCCLGTLVGCDAVGHVVGECVEVDRAFLDDLRVFFVVHEPGINTFVEEVLSCPYRVFASDLNVAAEVVLEVVFHRAGKDVLGIRCQRIDSDVADHVADHEIGVDLMAEFYNKSTCHKFIVQRFIGSLFIGFEIGELDRFCRIDVLFFHDAQTIQIADAAFAHARDVDLVECQPVFDLVLISSEQCVAVLNEQIDDLSVGEAAVLCDDCPRNLIMADGYQRFDIVFLTFIKYAVIECQTRFIGFFVVAVGIDSAPVDGQTEYVPAHLCKQSDILFVMMIEIDCLMGRIESVRISDRQEGSRRIDVAA